jgi:hypothetical protein
MTGKSAQPASIGSRMAVLAMRQPAPRKRMREERRGLPHGSEVGQRGVVRTSALLRGS